MQARAKRIVASLVVALVSSVVVAGAAQAETSAPPDWFERAAARSTVDTTIPNDRAGMLGVGGITAAQQSVPDWFERAALRHESTLVNPDDRGGVRTGSIVVAGAAPSVTAASDGFQWGDAGFGAAGALGLILLGALAAVTIRHRNRVILH